VSPTLISNVSEAVIEEVKAWQSRPLEELYPIVYLDALIADAALAEVQREGTKAEAFTFETRTSQQAPTSLIFKAACFFSSRLILVTAVNMLPGKSQTEAGSAHQAAR